uniref:DUF2294 domain-containing protein n=2 Tax=Bursaphelenchus xylophilus TaxID=6326 RepID=A0A1I7SJ65_BURXY
MTWTLSREKWQKFYEASIEASERFEAPAEYRERLSRRVQTSLVRIDVSWVGTARGPLSKEDLATFILKTKHKMPTEFDEKALKVIVESFGAEERISNEQESFFNASFRFEKADPAWIYVK